MTAHPLDDLRRGKARPRAICAICGRRITEHGPSWLTYRDGLGVMHTAHAACFQWQARTGKDGR
jgi:hypothetical protein